MANASLREKTLYPTNTSLILTLYTFWAFLVVCGEASAYVSIRDSKGEVPQGSSA